MVWMIRLGPLLCTWFSKSAKITGIGNPMIRLSRLMTIVFLIGRHGNTGTEEHLEILEDRICPRTSHDSHAAFKIFKGDDQAVHWLVSKNDQPDSAGISRMYSCQHESAFSIFHFLPFSAMTFFSS